MVSTIDGLTDSRYRERMECMVQGCNREPSEEMTVNDTGLLLVYSVCPEHAQDLRRGAMIAEPADVTRGLIGPA